MSPVKGRGLDPARSLLSWLVPGTQYNIDSILIDGISTQQNNDQLSSLWN